MKSNQMKCSMLFLMCLMLSCISQPKNEKMNDNDADQYLQQLKSENEDERSNAAIKLQK